MENLPSFEDSKPISNEQEALPPIEATEPVKVDTTQAALPDFESTVAPEEPSKVGAIVEGAAQGVLGPLATAAELGLSKLGVPNMTAEDIKARQEAHPIAHASAEAAGFGASLYFGIGEARLATALAKKAIPEAIPVFSKIGAKALDSAVQMGVFGVGDEINKALLGQGDPEQPVATAIAKAGAAGLLLGGAWGGIGGVLGKMGRGAADSLEKAKAPELIRDYLYGIGLASAKSSQELPAFVKQMERLQHHAPNVMKGIKLFQDMQENMITKASGKIVGGLLGPFISLTKADGRVADAIETIAGAVIGGKIARPLSKAFTGAIAKTLSVAEPDKVGQVLDYMIKAKQGEMKLANGVNKLFQYGTSHAVDDVINPKQDEDLKKYIEDGGLDQTISLQEQDQGFAEGGEVSPMAQPPITQATSGLAQVFPEQNILVNATKARVSNYLRSMQPQKPIKRPFDSDHKNPEREHSYNQLIGLANRPLSILNNIKSGRLTPGQVNHFKSMYPELHGQISKKLMEKIANEVHNKKKPPYKLRQSMSLFLGTDLDSSMAPASIMAAQATFSKGSSQVDMPQKAPSASSTKSLQKAGQQTMTPTQARIQRLNKV